MRSGTKWLDVEAYLERAEFEYLFESKAEFVFPVRRRGESPDFYAQLETEIRGQDILQVHAYRSVKEGYAKISRPASLSISADALLVRRPHLKLVKAEIGKIGDAYTIFDVPRFLRQTHKDALADLQLTRACLEVLQYLIEHREDVSGLLPRQIPHGQSTKLIGKESLLLKMFSFWRGESSRWSDFYDCFGLLDKPAEFRFFAPECLCQKQRLTAFHGLIARDWSSDFDFSDLTGTLVIENFESFYATLKQARSTLIIWGGGWKAVQLRGILPSLPEPVYYWGDIDKEGYEIFGYLKKLHPALKTVLMDQATIDKYRRIHQKKEIYIGPFRQVEGLQSEYEIVCRNGIQIEQEQIREDWPFGTDLE